MGKFPKRIKLVLTIVVIVIAFMVILEAINLFNPPLEKHFKVILSLPGLEFKVGEDIPFKLQVTYLQGIPYITSTRIRYGEHLFRLTVFDEKGEIVRAYPPIFIDTLGFRTLRAYVPHKERGSPLFPLTINLDKPGRYGISAKTAFYLKDTFYTRFRSLNRVVSEESEMIWIDVVAVP